MSTSTDVNSLMKSAAAVFTGRRALLGLGAAGAAAVAWRTATDSQDQNGHRPQPDMPAAATVMTSGARHSDHLPDLTLTTQTGRQVRLVSDLVRDRIVLVSFMYTHCNGICPLTSALFQKLRKPLFEQFGSDVRLISISLDPITDTPAELLHYSRAFKAENDNSPADGRAAWTFLTGTPENIEAARVAFGYTDPDPAIDQDKTQHAGLFTFGNDKTNRWCTFPVGLPFDQTLAGVVRIVGTSSSHRYAWLPRPGADQG
ncbi:MAG: SCO family protein [Planctomycetaceae bacterium]|nr:SCO family protein [Planctomycetaceae bacterium]